MRPRAAPLRGYGGGQESPERARSHESGWPRSRRRSSGAAPAELAERVSRDRRRKRRCCARPLMKAKAHGACGAQHFVFINARYSLAHTKAGARSGDAGNTDFPLGFYWVGCAVGCVVIYVFSFFTLCVLTCYRAYDGLRLRIESAMRGWMDGFQVR